MSSTLYTITVDTEEEWDWDGEFPVENLSLQNIQELPRFQDVCSRHGAAVTYFADHAVLADSAARRTLFEIADRPRVEIGMHLHPWNTPPLSGYKRVPPRETFVHNLPPALARAKLATVYDLFVAHGRRPTSFRGGRYSTNDTVQGFLREKGFVADASVLPFTTWDDDGAPDHRHRRLDPVRKPGKDGTALWEIPLTMGFTRRPFGFWHTATEAVARTPLRRLRLIGLAERAGLVRKVWLSFEAPLGQRMLPFLRMLRKLRPPCIDFTLHSSSLLPGGNGFTRTAADRDRVYAYLDEILGIVADWPEFQPATVTEVAQHLEHSHARPRN
jgi:hypothetical protein